MRKISLYRYIRPDGGVTVSTVRPDVDYTELYRLIADDGMMLTDGIVNTVCVDTNDPYVWSEVAGAETYTDPEEATRADYQNALREMGVEV